MEFESVVVTGANRGIGLGLVEQFVNLPKPPRILFATYRTEVLAKELQDLKKSSKECQVVLVKMDVNNPEDVSSLRRAVDAIVQDGGLTLLVNNAGAIDRLAFPALTRENLLFHFNVNTVGPFAVLKELYPLLVRSAERRADEKMSLGRAGVLTISAGSGSLADSTRCAAMFPDIIAYQVSKAAVNMLMRGLSVVTKDEGVLVVNMCPGWVKTNMTDDTAPLRVPESASAIINTIPTLDDTHHGAFIDRNGKNIDF